MVAQIIQQPQSIKIRLDNPNRWEWRIDPNGLAIRHNTNGPAIVSDLGYQAWYIMGKRHNVGAPAVKFDDFEMWFENGLLHRVNGPAITFSDGSQQWWLNGVRTK